MGLDLVTERCRGFDHARRVRVVGVKQEYTAAAALFFGFPAPAGALVVVLEHDGVRGVASGQQIGDTSERRADVLEIEFSIVIDPAEPLAHEGLGLCSDVPDSGKAEGRSRAPNLVKPAAHRLQHCCARSLFHRTIELDFHLSDRVPQRLCVTITHGARDVGDIHRLLA